MIELNSSNVKGAIYKDPDLYIMFKNNIWYVYRNVDFDVYDSFINYSEPGKFFRDYIDGVYSHKRLSAEEVLEINV